MGIKIHIVKTLNMAQKQKYLSQISILDFLSFNVQFEFIDVSTVQLICVHDCLLTPNLLHELSHCEINTSACLCFYFHVDSTIIVIHEINAFDCVFSMLCQVCNCSFMTNEMIQTIVCLLDL